MEQGQEAQGGGEPVARPDSWTQAAHSCCVQVTDGHLQDVPAFSSLELGWWYANSCSSNFNCSMLLLMQSRRIAHHRFPQLQAGGGASAGLGPRRQGRGDRAPDRPARTCSVFLFGAEQLHGHGAGSHAWRWERRGGKAAGSGAGASQAGADPAPI